MNKEIKKRKRRFWAMCLAAVLALCSMEPLMVEAASYIENLYDGDAPVAIGNYIYPGDIFYVQRSVHGYTCTILYQDVSGTEMHSDDARNSGSLESIDGTDYYKCVVSGYADVGGKEIDASLFTCWEVVRVEVSAGGNSKFVLHAMKREERNITYHLDGGINNPANPATYIEGTGVSELSQAAKDNYVFDGWYTDPSFAAGTKVTSISAGQAGDLDLYAKFTPANYTISYELNGGANASANPTGYTYGVGVSSFAAATKSGYTFEGWYTSPNFVDGTKVTSVSATQSGNLNLYAKFTAVQSSTNNNNSGNNTSDNNDNGAGGQSDSGNITPFNMYSMEGGGGEGGTWVYGSSDGLTVRGLGELWKFTGVKIDGNLIDKSNYSAREGSTIVTLSPEYLNTLGTGMHTLEMQWTDGMGETTFTIVAAKTSPKTGDDVSGISLSILTFALGIGMIAAWKRRIKTHIV